LATAVDTNQSATPVPSGASLEQVREWLDDAIGADADERSVAARDRGESIADLVRGLHGDHDLVSATLIFPLVHAGVLDSDRIAATFGAEMKALVDGLVSLGDFHLPQNWNPDSTLSRDQAESVRQMLLAIASDVRLVLVRLAEQLDSMRRLKNARAADKRAAARETQEVFAPLANRLGIWQLKWELEDLAFRYLEPATYRRIAGALRQRRSDRERFILAINHTLSDKLAAEGIAAEISGRPKHIFSIWRKMQRKQVDFDELFDIRAVRILVDSVADCYAALGVVHSLWQYIPGEFDDYVATPKENGYRSIHTAVIGPGGQALEVQIRSHEMHEHSELGVAAHWRYKEGGRGHRAFDEKINWLRQLLVPDSHHDTAEDFIDRVRAEIFEDRVYVISPRGDVVDLPQGATPLDFAYHVHTEVGHHCRGAKVNGRMVALTHVLATGEQVEIITAKNGHPSRDWLIPQRGYLASPRSRAKVRAWFRREDQDQNRRHGRITLERELGRLGLRDLKMPVLLKALKVGNVDELHVGLGCGDISLAAVTQAAAQQHPDSGERSRRSSGRGARPAPRNRSAVAVDGIGDLMSNFARCCHPVPPEPIAGYITQGRGVTIHRKQCRNLLRLRENHRERVLQVTWNEAGDDAGHQVEIRVEAYDRQGLTRDVTAVFADARISIQELKLETFPAHNTADIHLTINVRGLDELSQILHRLTTLPNVISAQRKM